MEFNANCPVLVGHLNNLGKGSDEQRALARQLVMILDDVESIAALIDHEFPAERHALARAYNIIDCAERLKKLVPVVVQQPVNVPVDRFPEISNPQQ